MPLERSKRVNRIHLLLTVLMAGIVMTSFGKNVDINSRALVHAMGIDKTPEGYEVTLQIFQPTGPGSSTAIDASQANIRAVSCSGSTIEKAIEDGRSQLGREPFFGHLQLICLGSGTDLSKPRELFRFVLEDRHIDLGTELCMSSSRAADIMNTKLSYAETSAEATGLILEKCEEYSRTVSCRLIDILSPEEDVCGAMPVLTAHEDSSVETISTRLIAKGRQCPCDLDEEGALGVNILTGRAEKGSFTVKAQGGLTDISLEDLSISRRLEERGEELILRVSIEGRTLISQGDRELILKKADQRLAEICIGAKQVTLDENSCDVIGLRRMIRHSFPEKALANKGHTDKLYPSVKLELSVDLRSQ